MRFQVVAKAAVQQQDGSPSGGRKCLHIFGEPEGDLMFNACHTALAWVRLHQSALRAYFNGAVADWSSPEMQWWMEMVEVQTAGYRKSGRSIGLAAACSFLQAFTGVGVERIVLMTGYVTLSGRVLPVKGLAGKLGAAHAGGHLVVLPPKGNAAEANEILTEKGYRMWVEPVESMAEVVYHVFKYSVLRRGLPPAPPLGLPDEGRLVCAHALYRTPDGFSIGDVECALLPVAGGGRLTVTGFPCTSNVEDAQKALHFLTQCYQSPPPTLHLLRDLRQWDVYVEFVTENAGDGMMTVAVTAALLALASGRALNSRIVFGAGMSIVGDVQDAWLGRWAEEKVVQGMCERGFERVMLHPDAGYKVRHLIGGMTTGDGGQPSIEVVDLPMQLGSPADLVGLAKMLWLE